MLYPMNLHWYLGSFSGNVKFNGWSFLQVRLMKKRLIKKSFDLFDKIANSDNKEVCSL